MNLNEIKAVLELLPINKAKEIHIIDGNQLYERHTLIHLVLSSEKLTPGIQSSISNLLGDEIKDRLFVYLSEIFLNYLS